MFLREVLQKVARRNLFANFHWVEAWGIRVLETFVELALCHQQGVLFWIVMLKWVTFASSKRSCSAISLPVTGRGCWALGGVARAIYLLQSSPLLCIHRSAAAMWFGDSIH